jgi:hypothetical protein
VQLVTNIRRALFWLLFAAVSAFGQDNFSLCDINHDHAVNVLDAQAMASQALGTSVPANDLNVDGAVNVADVQTEINAILYGCPFYSITPRFAITTVSLINQGWVPSDIPSAGNLTILSAAVQSVSLVNQAWIPADVPSAGNVTSNAVNAISVSVVNQAWISADIPSPGDVRFDAGLLVSVNNAGAGGRTVPSLSALGLKVVAAGSSTTPVDLSTVNNGDALLAGQTVRFRVYPPEEALAGSDFLLARSDLLLAGSDFLIDGTPLRVHTPFEVMVTAPANASGFDLQAVIYSRDGRVWRTPPKHLLIVPDPGQTLSGRAVHAHGSAVRDDSSAVRGDSSATVSLAIGSLAIGSLAIGVRTNGLTAEYFRADKGIASWSDLSRPADKRGFVTAVNQPDSSAFGTDPFGTGFSGNYATRFRGEILVTMDGQHQFYLNAPLGSRLIVDGGTLTDTPPASFSPEAEAAVTLAAGWHTIEIDSYQPAFRANLQLSWRQPNSPREIVRPESLATEVGSLAVTDTNGWFRVNSFPNILNPLEWHTVPANTTIRVIAGPSNSEERPIQ